MNSEQFMAAIAIVSCFHSSKITINLPKNNFVGNLGKGEYNIYIDKCCAGCVNALKDAGFMLTMTENGLNVNKI